MKRTPRYAAHPSIAHMRGGAPEISRYLKAAPAYVNAMYAEPRAGLRPIHDALEELASSLGSDIRLCPGQTIVPVYRRQVIAQIKPATHTRIDFGLALGGLKGKGRLVETGGFQKQDRITHKIGITTLDEIDEFLKRWLLKAYQLDE